MRDDLRDTYDAWSATYEVDENPMLRAERIAVESILEKLSYRRVLDTAAHPYLARIVEEVTGRSPE